jgi:hypothetical protein
MLVIYLEYMPQNVYSWDIIHRFFPPEEIQKYRHQIINDWKSGLFKNEEIWEKYGMCENTFLDHTLHLDIEVLLKQ